MSSFRLAKSASGLFCCMALLLIGCDDSGRAESTRETPTSVSGNLIQTNTSSYPYSMSCDPLRFSVSQRVTVFLPQLHGRDMVINTPDNRSFYLSWDGEDASEGHGPPIKGAAFEKMKQILLSDRTKAYDPDRNTLDRIFRKRGSYEVIVGEWLDGDEAPRQGYCKLYFAG